MKRHRWRTSSLLSRRPRGRFENDLGDELEFHFEGRIDELVAAGWTREDARKEADRIFGDRRRIARECRKIATRRKLPRAPGGGMESYLNDIRHTVRQLARNPGFTAAAVITLALGIGANSTMFGLFNAMRMVAQRFERPEELVFLWTSEGEWDDLTSSAPDLLDWRERAESFEQMGIFASTDRTMTGEGEPAEIRTVRASANLLPMLGLEAQIGRLPSASEDSPTADRVAVLTDRLWQGKFGGRAEVLGERINLDDVPHTIIGVLPAHLQFDRLWRDATLFTPLRVGTADLRRDGLGYWSIARLRPDVTIEQAQAELDGIAAGLADAYPDTNGDRTARVESLQEFFLSTDDKIAMVAALIAVTGVLLIACINLANLMLARATARGGEIAVRVAMGAGRARIVRQLLTESVLLAALGGAVGLATSLWLLDLFNTNTDLAFFRPDEIGLNPVILTYTFLISLGSALAFGLAPGLAATRLSIGEALKGTGASAGRRRMRFRNGIVVAQLALTLPLLISCAMAGRQLAFFESLDFGFDTENLLTMNVNVPMHRYQGEPQRAAFFRDAMEALEAVPGIAAVGASLNFPVGAGQRRGYEGSLQVEGSLGEEERPGDVGGFDVVTPGYFQAMGVSLVSGRVFSARDRSDGQLVAVVNERMAAHYWPDDDALGKRFTFDPTVPEPEWFTVVGVVADFGSNFWGEPTAARVYLPHAQRPFADMVVSVRTHADPFDMIPSLRAAVHGIDPGVPLSGFLTVDDHVDIWLNETRSIATMVGGMGLLALGLASVGLFGTISFSVVQRTREIGVRVALGARRRAIMQLVFRRSLRLAAIGIGIGLVLSLAVGIALISTIYGIEAPRPTTVLGVLALLLAVALVAAYFPARRATRIDPLIALRAE